MDPFRALKAGEQIQPGSTPVWIQAGDPDPSKSQEKVLALETRLSFCVMFIVAYPSLTAVGALLIYAVVSGIRLGSLLALSYKVCLQKPCCLCGELYPRSQILY